jgi:hypothetical protein
MYMNIYIYIYIYISDTHAQPPTTKIKVKFGVLVGEVLGWVVVGLLKGWVVGRLGHKSVFRVAHASRLKCSWPTHGSWLMF